MRNVELMILSVAGTVFFLGSYWFALYFHLIDASLITLFHIPDDLWILVICVFLVSFLYSLLYRALFRRSGSMKIMVSFGVLLFLGFIVIIKKPLAAEDFIYYGLSINLHIVFLSYSIYYRTLVGLNNSQER